MKDNVNIEDKEKNKGKEKSVSSNVSPSYEDIITEIDYNISNYYKDYYYNFINQLENDSKKIEDKISKLESFRILAKTQEEKDKVYEIIIQIVNNYKQNLDKYEYMKLDEHIRKTIDLKTMDFVTNTINYEKTLVNQNNDSKKHRNYIKSIF